MTPEELDAITPDIPLDSLDRIQIEIDGLMPAFNSELWLTHLVCHAAGRRSKQLVAAFRLCVEQNLDLVAPAITRIQLDSALRLHALRLVDDGNHLAKFVLEGGELRKYKLRDHSPRYFDTLQSGPQQLTDSFLYQELSKVYSPSFHELNAEDPSLTAGHSNLERLLDSPIGDVYQDGNKYIHLSQSHIMELFTLGSLKQGEPQLRELDSDSHIDWCPIMLFVTDVVLREIQAILSLAAE